MTTKNCRIDNNEKLREKVDEALAVFNDYVKNQKADSGPSQDAIVSEQRNGAGSEEVKV